MADLLLLETGFYLLQEDGVGRIVLEATSLPPRPILWVPPGYFRGPTNPITKRPDEKAVYGVNFGNMPPLRDGSHSLTGTPTAVVQPSVPSGLADLQVGQVTVDGISAPAIDTTGQIALFTLSGGTAGETYELHVDCSDTGGGTQSAGVTLVVRWKP